MRPSKSNEQLSGTDRNMPGKQNLNNLCFDGSHDLLGELWTMDEIFNARHAFSAVCEGVDANLTITEMRKLESRGLVRDIEEGPKRGCKANRYTFMWNDKLEQLVAASRELPVVKG